MSKKKIENSTKIEISKKLRFFAFTIHGQTSLLTGFDRVSFPPIFYTNSGWRISRFQFNRSNRPIRSEFQNKGTMRESFPSAKSNFKPKSGLIPLYTL